MRRAANTGHFNAKDDGQTGRNKHADQRLGKANMKDVKNLMPYLTTA